MALRRSLELGPWSRSFKPQTRTAYPDYGWDGMMEKLGASDNLVILKKPFDRIGALQLADAPLINQSRAAGRIPADELERMVAERTAALEAAQEQRLGSCTRWKQSGGLPPALLTTSTTC